MAELGASAGVSLGAEDRAPQVRCGPNLNEVAARLGEEIAKLDLFDLNGELVWFDHLGRQRQMTGRVFRTWINQFLILYFRSTDDGRPIAATLKTDDANAILESRAFRAGVRVLEGVNLVRLPVVRKDGALELLPWGYDAETKVYTVPDGVEYDEAMDMDVALGWIDRLLGDFPFADARSRAVQVAAMAAIFVKHLPGGQALRPGFLWLANKPGSGKSVLAKIGLYAVLGHAAAAKMKKGEEFDKELEAFSRSAIPYIFFDNVYGGVASDRLDQLLTSKASMGRAMGGHGTFMARNTALLLITGNGLDLNEDAQRRFRVVDLFEKGDPQARKITLPLDDDVMESPEFRSKTLAAMYALVKNWWDQGMPAPGLVLASFEPFSRMLGGIVKAAGFGEPFEEAVIPDAISPEKAEMRELLEEVVRDMLSTGDEPGGVKEKEYSVQDFARMARAQRLFTEMIGDEEEGKRLTIKMDGLTGDLKAHAMDEGYLTPAQASKFGKMLAKKAGTEFEVLGSRIEFGRREQHRKRIFTMKILE